MSNSVSTLPVMAPFTIEIVSFPLPPSAGRLPYTAWLWLPYAARNIVMLFLCGVLTLSYCNSGSQS